MKEKLKKLENELLELRKTAFVDCIMKKMEKDNIVGVFGENIDEGLLYGYDLIPIPIIGLDSYIFDYGYTEGCDPIRSTMVYLETEKCPLLFSSKMYILDGSCPKIEEEFLRRTEKTVYKYNSKKDLDSLIKKEYGSEFSKKRFNEAEKYLKEIKSILEEVEESDFPSKEFFLLSFYTKYIIDLKKRKEFIERVVEKFSFKKADKRKEIIAMCPGGIINNINSNLEENHYKIVQNNKNADITCCRCIYNAPTCFNYTRGESNDR